MKRVRSRGKECVVPQCTSYEYCSDGSRSSRRFFKFPTKGSKKTRWCTLIKRQDGRDGFRVTESTVICDKHFKNDDVRKSLGGVRVKLIDGAEPTIFSWSQGSAAKKRKAPKARATEVITCTTTICDSNTTDTVDLQVEDRPEEPLSDSEVYSPPESPEQQGSEAQPMVVELPPIIPEHVCTKRDVEVQTEEQYFLSTDEHCDHSYAFSFNANNTQELLAKVKAKLEVKEEIINSLKMRIGELEVEVADFRERQFSLEKYKDDQGAVQFYTGFPNYDTLMAFHRYLEPKVSKLQYWGNKDIPDSRPYQEKDKKKPGRKRKLSTINELFLVLVRLRVGLFMKDIADRFGISPATVSKIFCTWINFLYFELKLLFPFPSQDSIRMNMPSEFSMYATTRIIIDCTEVFVEVPSSMLAQSQTWSNYKHHNTFKVLVGISPNGQVIFISKLWGGRVSDKLITEKSGLINHLEPGDNVMADRGFDIQCILPARVNLNIPPFKGDREQLTAEEVQETAHIAAVRIHVERAIGRIKNYHILDGTLPLTLAHVADQIFTVCSYLTNFLPPLLPPKTMANQ